MYTKVYKIAVLVIVILVIAITIIYKATREDGPGKTSRTPETKQLSDIPKESNVQENNQLPVMLYFGRFT